VKICLKVITLSGSYAFSGNSNAAEMWACFSSSFIRLILLGMKMNETIA
jgi:hypothetical protein